MHKTIEEEPVRVEPEYMAVRLDNQECHIAQDMKRLAARLRINYNSITYAFHTGCAVKDAYGNSWVVDIF